MGFFFRRSASFGPFRLNFSKSGVGASVGVKGARLTMTPKGTTYITVGRGGFYYRQNLSASNSRPLATPQYQKVEATPSADEIKTADVEELLESSKGELVENLNKRAQMFDSAIILFVLSAICAVVGFVRFTDTASNIIPALPDVSASPDGSRQANRADEYALLLAHYGQPSTVVMTQAGSVAVRSATFAVAHTAVDFVPAGCVDSYEYYQTHKNDVAPTGGTRRRRTPIRTPKSSFPACVPSADGASTIVGYQDTSSGSAIESETAERNLANMSAKSSVPPTVKMPDSVHAKAKSQSIKPEDLRIAFDEGTLKAEQQRVAEVNHSNREKTKTGVMFMFCSLLPFCLAIVVHRKNVERRTTRLVYDLSGPLNTQQQFLDATLEQLASSRAIWRVDSKSTILDWKRNAGAAYNVERTQIAVRRSVPSRVESNLIPLCIDLGAMKMFFLPDQVLYWQRGTFASIEYKDLSFQADSTRFIEDHVQTSDSQQVGSTWRYVRKDGGPDQRFSNNRQLPIMLYGVVIAASSGGLNLLLHTSNVASASSFASSFESFQSSRDRLKFDQESQNSTVDTADGNGRDTRPTNVQSAMDLLDLKPGATAEQAAAAYRRMAQMYHPDKVIGLGPELRQLADERMKDINAAHSVLSQFFAQSS